MATPIPFRYITGLPERAKFEIERDFLHIQGQISGSSTIYDAIIDPALTTSSAGIHQYKNLTDLLAGESLTPTRTFTVGVIPRNDSTITETSTLTLAGPIAIAALGMANNGVGNMFSAGARVKWNLAGQQLSTTYAVFLQGLSIFNTGTQINGLIIGSNGVIMIDNCRLEGSDITNGSGSNRKISAPNATSGGFFYAYDSEIDSMQFNGSTVCIDSHYSLSPALGTSFSLMPNNSALYWDGGVFQNHQSSATTINFNGSGQHVRWDRDTVTLDGSSASGTHTLNINGAGRNYFDIRCLGNQFNVTITSGAGGTHVSGTNLNNVTVVASSGTDPRTFFGSLTGQLDVGGPADVRALIKGAGSSVLLNGPGVRADLEISASTSTPWLNFSTLTDSVVTVTLANPAAGSKAYTIGASCTRNVIVISGSTAGNFSVASTDAGTSSTLITEAGAPTSSAPGDFTVAGHMILSTLGKTLKVKEGANAKMGQAVLVGGTVTVSTTAVTANSRIFLTTAIAGGTLGILSVGTITAATSFVINSTNAADTSTVNWIILEPA